MLFNSYIFVFAFFPLVVTGYYWLQRMKWEKAALGYLIVMSMVFYGYQNIRYLAILIASILCNYLLVLLMGKTKTPLWRRIFLAAGLLLNLGIL